MHRFLVALVVLVTVSPLWSQQPGNRPDRPRRSMMAERFMKFPEHAPAVGTEAPDFVLKTPEGREVRLADFRDKSYVVLEFGSYT